MKQSALGSVFFFSIVGSSAWIIIRVKTLCQEWYKFSKKTATKENAILKLCEACKILPDNIIAFGDDLVDIGMLQLCGKGIAMGNALDEVKMIADVVIGSNDEEGIAEYLTETFLA